MTHGSCPTEAFITLAVHHLCRSVAAFARASATCAPLLPGFRLTKSLQVDEGSSFPFQAALFIYGDGCLLALNASALSTHTARIAYIYIHAHGRAERVLAREESLPVGYY